MTQTQADTGAVSAQGAAIEHMCREAGAMLRDRFGDPGTVTGKGMLADQHRAYDLVTELDFACERRILELIADVSPNAVVIGEEGGAVHVAAAVSNSGAGAQRPIGALEQLEDLWLVDPLDGTVNFAHSVPFFGVSIARYSHGVPQAGAIYDPLLDELFAFDGTDTASLNGRPISVGVRTELHDCMLGVGSEGPRFPEYAREFRGWRRMGSAALSLAYVACGRYDAYVQLGNLAPWDFAAGAPLVLAAGGAACDHELREWRHPLEGWTGIVAASVPVHRQLVGLLADGA